MKRGELKKIYDILENNKKSEWAENAEYSSYQGLYRYLSNNNENEAYPRIINALIKTIGKEEFEKLKNKNLQIENSTIVQYKKDIKSFKKEMIDLILELEELETVNEFKKELKDLVSICENQISILKIKEDIK